MRKFFLLLFGVTQLHCSSVDEEKTRPNILLLVADDLGYADLSIHGSEIQTPNIDALAARGTRFSRFHTAPSCAPTRAMLLTGNDNHIAGMGRQGFTSELWGYEGHLTNRVVTVPQLLRDDGYHTYMVGKWHLGVQPEHNPHNKGFERSFVLLPGAGNHYNDLGLFPSMPVSQYTEDGQSVNWPEGAYSTDFYTDKLIDYIGANADNGKPFFAFAAFTSPHWPLQVHEEHWKKYLGKYAAGYDHLKEINLERLKKAGMIPDDAALPESHPLVTSWDDLTEADRRLEVRKMELYAGMVDNLDYNVGRLINFLDDRGLLENTLIVFMSDNGAAAEDFYNRGPFTEYTQAHFDNEYDNMGKPSSYVSYGPQWAEAGNAPFKYYKGYTTEGGLIAPMVLAGPGIRRTGEIHDGFASLLDLAPTLYELAGIEYPETYAGKEIFPLKGESMVSFLSGSHDHIHGGDDVFEVEQSGNATVIKGDWKILHSGYPITPESFQLFDLNADLNEEKDLSELNPEKKYEMLELWEKYRETSRISLDRPEQE